ncbi:MAG TPA: GntR family transcriptional regulator [Pyrinomonadaceae bacterium]|jgi:GntR family transcriptional regulator|nr:GntR family transcriptional regulator [Pyrinomonadaceae bacterium]
MKPSLDRTSTAPLHAQIHAALRERIDSNELSAGSLFPSERELADSYGVSRMTVRQALQALRQEGVIYQERGRGTFVSKRKLDVHTRNLGGFTEEMLRRGLRPSSRILVLKRDIADNQTAESLGIDSGESVFRLERLRLADDMPMAYETAFLPAKMCPKLDEFDFAKISLYEVLEKNFGVNIHHAEEVLEAACASGKEAKILAIKAKEPLLVVNRVVFTETNQAIESVQTLYRADRYRATFFLTKNTP